MYEQKPCKASCVLVVVGYLAQCAFGVNSHYSSVKDLMHHHHLARQVTSLPFRNQFKTKKQQPTTGNLTHTKPQGYKSTSLQRQITTIPQAHSLRQPAANNQPTTNIQEPAATKHNL